MKGMKHFRQLPFNAKSFLLTFFPACLSGVMAPVSAQIIPDNTLGTSTSGIIPNVVINGASADLINGGARRDTNLFHSFSQFNINDGQRVYFANPSGVINILTRVTGGNGSNILGTLGVDGNANLFLINPNGIMFGENARLDVRGSFVGTTANSVQFGEQGLFSVTNPEEPALLTVNPSALFFNNQLNNQQLETGTITNRARLEGLNGETNFIGGPVGLQVPNGQTLALIGGNVWLNDGNLTALGGKIEVGGVVTGNVNLSQNGNGIKFNYDGVNNFGDIRVDSTSVMDAIAQGGGDINFTGKNLSIDDSLILAGITGNTGSSNIQAGDIKLDIKEIITIDNGSLIFNYLDSQTIGNAGNVNISAQRLNVNSGSQVGILNFGNGNTGNVNIKVGETIELDGGEDGLFGGLFAQLGRRGKGNVGSIFIETGSLNIRNGAAIGGGTFGNGNVGSININARDTVSLSALSSLAGQSSSAIFNNVDSGAVGNSGGINIKTGSLLASDESLILSSVAGRGNSGAISIEARDTVALTGVGDLTLGVNGFDDARGTIFSSSVEFGGVGNSGGILIKTGNLSLDSSQINSSTAGTGDAGNIIIEARDGVALLRGSDMFTEVTCACESRGGGVGGVGKGGDIRITTGSLLLDIGANLRADTEAKGDGGNIIINARERVVFKSDSDDFSGGAFTQVEPDAVGKGGDIVINTPILSISGSQEVNTRTQGQGDAGGIFINVGTNAGTVSLTGEDVRITSGASQRGRKPGTFGNGGNIEINADLLSINNGARIFADSEFSDGSAGNININSDRIHLNNNSSISANTLSANNNREQATININGNALILRRNSNITTNARGANVVGGNININTGVLAALENSDISANSTDFRGGLVKIAAQGIFGTQPRLAPTPESDITATGATPDLSGRTEINTPDLDPSQGIIELPNQVVDRSDQIGKVCPRGADVARKIGTFTVTGKGGSLPQSSLELLPGEIDLRRLVDINPDIEPNQKLQSNQPSNTKPAAQSPQPIIEAQGWIRDRNGKVQLIAHSPQSQVSLGNNGIGCRN